MKHLLLIGFLFLGGMLPYTTAATANTLNEELIKAIHGNDIEAVKLLIEDGDVNTISETGHTALMIANWVGDKEIAELLIRAGADVHAKQNGGWTALIYASWRSPRGFFVSFWRGLVGEKTNADEEIAYQERQKGIIVELLIAAGANVNAKANDGATALMVASLSGHKEIVGILIRAGAEVNATTYDGEHTALSIANEEGFAEIAALLIDAGAK